MSTPPLRLLVVEDNPADQELIIVQMSRAQPGRFETVVADSLQAATQVLCAPGQDLGVDLVLLDLSLPDGDDIEAFLSGCFDRNLPVVVLTGLDDEEVAMQMLQRGAQDYLVKGQIDSRLLVRSVCYAFERQRIETALKRANDELESRVQERTKELEVANQELQRQIKEREGAEAVAQRQRDELAHLARLNVLGEMTSNLAHELNQPLTAIVAYSGGCIRRLRAGEYDLDLVLSDIEKLMREAKRGGDIIKRIRQFVSRREPERVATDLNAAVRNVAQIARLKAEELCIQIELQLDPSIPIVPSDRVQIEQVILNLVNNAFEASATANQSRIYLQTMATPGWIEIRVKDTAGGSDEDMAHLFEAFFSTKTKGLGLGLSISRSIVDAHSGKLTLESNDLGGITAIVSLPVRADGST